MRVSEALATPVFVVPNPGFDITSGLDILNGEEVGVFRAIITVEPFLFGVCNVILPIVVILFDGALPSEGTKPGPSALTDNTVWPTDLAATPEFLEFAGFPIHARYVGDVNVVGNVIPVNIVVFDLGAGGYAHVPIVGWTVAVDNLCTPYRADVLYLGETASGALLRECQQQAVHTFKGLFILRTDLEPDETLEDTGTCGTVTPCPPPGPDSEIPPDGLPDSFEEPFGGNPLNGSILIDNPPGNTATAAGCAAAGSEITTGDLTVTFPPGTTVDLSVDQMILIKFEPGNFPKVTIKAANLAGQTKMVEMPFGLGTVVCIDDSPVATIIPGTCGPPKVEITIPLDGGSNTSGPYTVSRSGSIITIEGLVHTAIAIFPPAVGGTVELRANADALAEESGSSSARDYATPAAAIAAGAIALVAVAWYARRRLS